MNAAPQENKSVVIVSGLPRSGTSMMMKMLAAGGMPLLTDDIRQADVDNPKGYFELEKVKDLEKDASVLDESVGKAVKIVSPLLFHLPLDRGYGYKVIFMERDLGEILASQKKMADRLQQGDREIDEAALRKNYVAHLEEIKKWLAEKEEIEVLYVGHREVINNPLPVAKGIATFLQRELPVEQMAMAVDKSLYRQKESGGEDAATPSGPTDDEAIAEQLRRLGYL